MKKQLFCKCCDEEIFDRQIRKMWITPDGIFHKGCIARWYGDPLEESPMDDEEIIKEYGIIVER